MGGALETLKIKLGRELLPVLTQFVNWISKKAIPWIQKHLIPWVRKLATWLGENLPQAAQAIVDWWNNDGQGFFHEFGLGLEGVWNDTKDLAKSINKLLDAFQELTGQDSKDDQRSFWELIGMSLSNALIPLRLVLWTLTKLVDSLTWLVDHANDIKDALDIHMPDLSGLNPLHHLGLAAGGQVKRAAGGTTLVGEHGPELLVNGNRIIPHSRTMGMRGGPGPTYNILALDPMATERVLRRLHARGNRVTGMGGLATA
jgi:hypothetical protein